MLQYALVQILKAQSFPWVGKQVRVHVALRHKSDAFVLLWDFDQQRVIDFIFCEAHIPPEKKLFLVAVRFRQSYCRVRQKFAKYANLSFQTVYNHRLIQITHRSIVFTVDEMAVEELFVLPSIPIFFKLCCESMFIDNRFFTVLW